VLFVYFLLRRFIFLRVETSSWVPIPFILKLYFCVGPFMVACGHIWTRVRFVLIIRHRCHIILGRAPFQDFPVADFRRLFPDSCGGPRYSSLRLWWEVQSTRGSRDGHQ